MSLLRKRSLSVLGVMTGTSGDGVDGAVVSFTGKYPNLKWKLLSSYHLPLPPRLIELLEKSEENSFTGKEYGEIEFLLSTSILKVAKNLYRKTPFQVAGVHGQTLFHLPPSLFPYPSTHQVYSPYLLAESLQVPVVWDFRRGDLAQGGEGAPLAPLAHLYLFHKQYRYPAVFLNIGGFSNLTYLPKDDPDSIQAWDVGPAMNILNRAMRIFFSLPYDPQGKYGKKGKLQREIVDLFLTHPFFQKTPPRSAGRETFREWSSSLLKKGREISPYDFVRSLVEGITLAILSSLEGKPVKMVVVGGGGGKNRLLMERIQEGMGKVPVFPVTRWGIPLSQVEPMAFALLAYERIQYRPGNLPQITSARKKVLLGSIAEPTPKKGVIQKNKRTDYP